MAGCFNRTFQSIKKTCWLACNTTGHAISPRGETTESVESGVAASTVLANAACYAAPSILHFHAALPNSVLARFGSAFCPDCSFRAARPAIQQSDLLAGAGIKRGTPRGRACLFSFSAQQEIHSFPSQRTENACHHSEHQTRVRVEIQAQRRG